MKHILFPTDFSENSKKPIPCLGYILEKSSAKLTILHAMHVPIIDTQMPVNILHTLDKEMERKTNNALKEICAEIRDSINDKSIEIECKTVVRMGFGSEEIIAYAEDKKVDLIVMGTHGESGAADVLMGSITGVVIRKTGVPVLAIPQKCGFSNFTHLVFATELKDDEVEAVKEVIEFARVFNSQLTLLHIDEEGNGMNDNEKRIVEGIRENANYPQLQFGLIAHEDVAEGISEYIKVHDVNILAMATKKRNLFERIFDKSLSKKMAFHSEIPVLVMHK